MNSVTLVLPTYNELEAIQIILPSLVHLPVERIIVVDDNSPDGTGKAVVHLGLDKVGLITRHARGLGGAIRVGAITARTDYVLVMDSDGQHIPMDASHMLQLLDGQDLIVGSRFARGAEIKGLPFWRRLASRGLNHYANWNTKTKCSDPMSGFFIARRELLINTRTLGFKVLYDILANTKGLEVAEVPITFNERLGGVSKVSLKELFHLFRTQT